MSEKKVGPPILLILTMILGSAGIAIQENPLKSSRPSNSKDFSYSYPAMENVDARLWQDPLIAIEVDIMEAEKKRNKEKTAEKIIQEFKNKIKSKIAIKLEEKQGEEPNSKTIDTKEKQGEEPDSKTIDIIEKYINDLVAGDKNMHTCQGHSFSLFEHWPVKKPTDALSLKNNPDGKKSCIGYTEGVTFLGVTAQWGHYIEDQEQRRRLRYAVVTGLSASGYTAKNPTHIGYLKPENDDYLYPQYIPFEIFLRENEETSKEDSNPPKTVVVLWLDDSNFGKKTGDGTKPQGPFKFQQLIKDLVNEKNVKNKKDKPQIEMAMIGPANSDSLNFWIETIKEDGNGVQKPIYEDPEKNICSTRDKDTDPDILKIFSTYPTASTESIYSKNKIKPFKETSTESDKDNNKDRYKHHLDFIIPKINDRKAINICIDRIMADDRELVNSIKNELINRGIKITQKELDANFNDNPKIVLISEAETLYGRGFRKYLAEAFSLTDSCIEDPSKVRLKPWANTCPIINVNYISGLDGEVRASNDNQNKKEKENKLSSNNPESSLERPHGNKQYDYLKRMSAKLRLMNQKWKKKESFNLPPKHRTNIQAIGILGTDTYDKLLILQEFKKDFPDAIFFTTDLEAHYLHPAEYNSTRNLLIATGFGLELKEEFQGQTPPFRENYQTATYLATQIAFNFEKKDSFSDHDLIYPKIFEIGRTHAIDISPDHSSDTPEKFSPTRTLPDRESLKSKFSLYIVLILSISLSLASFYGKKEKGFIRRHILLHFIFYTGIILFIFINFDIHKHITCVNSDTCNGYNEDPLFWWEGVSVWPTNFIRLVSCLFSITFLVVSVKWLDQGYKEIRNDFFPNSDGSGKKEIQRIKGWKKWFTLLLIEETSKKNQKGKRKLTPPRIWENYLYRSRFTRRLIRAIVLSLITFFISYLIFTLFAVFPNIPARSDYSFKMTIGILIFTFFSFLVLLYYILGEIRLCGKFISAIQSAPNKWDKKVYANLKIDKNVQNNDGLSTFADGWIKIKLIARFTQKVDRLIYFPFIILSLIVISRFRFFDDWHLPLPLLIILFINLAISLFIGFKIHSDAIKAKRNILDDLEKEHLQIQISNTLPKTILANNPNLKTDDIDPTQFASLRENIMKKIEDIQEGAYLPFWERPVLQSMFIPFGGYGGIALLKYALFM